MVATTVRGDEKVSAATRASTLFVLWIAPSDRLRHVNTTPKGKDGMTSLRTRSTNSFKHSMITEAGDGACDGGVGSRKEKLKDFTSNV
jgi:hypothetical protein